MTCMLTGKCSWKKYCSLDVICSKIQYEVGELDFGKPSGSHFPTLNFPIKNFPTSGIYQLDISKTYDKFRFRSLTNTIYEIGISHQAPFSSVLCSTI